MHGRERGAGRRRSLAEGWPGIASLGALLLLVATSCSKGKPAAPAGAQPAAAAPAADASTDPTATGEPSRAAGPTATLPPNELGVIPVLEYHLIEEPVKNEYQRTPAELRQDLEELYRRGYRPVNMTDVLDKKIQSLPRGISPVVFTFDDASTSQFRWLGSPGNIDPNSAIGIWLEFQKKHPDWGSKAVFCMLPAAEAGRSFFGNKDIDGQKTEWRFPKVKWLYDHGFELCNHTLWHARLDKYSDAVVQEQIARGQLAIDSVVPGYRVRTFALPLGMWPKNRPLAWSGSWTDPKTKNVVRYHYDAVLEVSGNPDLSPYRPDFNPHSINRQIMYRNGLVATLNRLDKPGPNSRYISDGAPGTVARPAADVAHVSPAGGAK